MNFDEKFRMWAADLVAQQLKLGFPMLKLFRRTYAVETFEEATRSWPNEDLCAVFRNTIEQRTSDGKIGPSPLWLKCIDDVMNVTALGPRRAPCATRITLKPLKAALLRAGELLQCEVRKVSSKEIDLVHRFKEFHVVTQLELLTRSYDLILTWSIWNEDGRIANTCPIRVVGLTGMTAWKHLVDDEIPSVVDVVVKSTQFFFSEMDKVLADDVITHLEVP
jgi:hypothetical protein